MKTFKNTILGALSLTLGVAALTAAVSCARDGGVGEHRELVVDVQMSNSDWTTRANGGAVALDEQLEVVAEYGTQDTQDTLLTRGTPLGAASELQSIGFAAYTNSVFTRTCTATYAGGSWSIANNVLLDLDKNKYSYYAYAPAAAAGNGIVVQADGKKLTYTAPTDITKQPDLCWAAPIINDQEGKANFEMKHALTAVGIKVRADSVEIKSIKLLGVNTVGTLDLTTGVWGGVVTPKDLAFTLSNNKPATGNGVADITASNGYLMLPPQTVVGDGKKLEIVYKYNGETSWRTGTHQLSKITDGDYLAGQKIIYVIQLKSTFSLTLTPASASVPFTAGSYTFGYTTGSSAPSIDPTATCSDSWITGLAVNRGTGKISFNYAQNSSKFAPRKTEIKVTSGFTTKTLVLTQDGLGVLIAGTVWTKSNLTGDASTNTGHRLEANPQDLAMYFKWGSTFVYQRASSTSDGGGWSGETTGAATTPSSGSGTNYDYGSGLGGGTNPGDPCQKLGANYKTPTRAQWLDLKNTGSRWGLYNGQAGRFLGPKASFCDKTTIQDGCIFLPDSGCRIDKTGEYSYRLDGPGFYWSSSVYNSNKCYACNISLDGVGVYPDYAYPRSNGFSVRCIYE